MKPAILVIDMLNDFVHGVLKVERAPRITPNIKRLLEHARRKGIPVIYTNDSHLPKVDREFKVWPEHAVAGSWGAEVIEELRPAEGDYIVRKRRYSAFYSTDLDLLLRELEVDTLILTGLVTDVCVQHTAADAFFRGYHIIVPRDCVDSLTEERHLSALEYMKNIYGCEVVSTDELLGRL